MVGEVWSDCGGWGIVVGIRICREVTPGTNAFVDVTNIVTGCYSVTLSRDRATVVEQVVIVAHCRAGGQNGPS